MKELLRYRNIFIGIIIVVVISIIIYKIQANYSLEIKKIEAQQAELEKGREMLEEWSALEGRYQQIAGGFLQRDTLFFKKMFEEKAKNLGIDISSLSISQKERDDYWETSAKIVFTAKYNKFLEFVKSLAEKKIEIERVKLAGSPDNIIRIEAELKGIVIK
jgi:Na+-transporting NADH:ubiquinone oxidoreductase subunit NqrC